MSRIALSHDFHGSFEPSGWFFDPPHLRRLWHATTGRRSAIPLVESDDVELDAIHQRVVKDRTGVPMHYEHESLQERIARRKQRWTPTEIRFKV